MDFGELSRAAPAPRAVEPRHGDTENRGERPGPAGWASKEANPAVGWNGTDAVAYGTGTLPRPFSGTFLRVSVVVVCP